MSMFVTSFPQWSASHINKPMYWRIDHNDWVTSQLRSSTYICCHFRCDVQYRFIKEFVKQWILLHQRIYLFDCNYRWYNCGMNFIIKVQIKMLTYSTMNTDWWLAPWIDPNGHTRITRGRWTANKNSMIASFTPLKVQYGDSNLSVVFLNGIIMSLVHLAGMQVSEGSFVHVHDATSRIIVSGLMLIQTYLKILRLPTRAFLISLDHSLDVIESVNIWWFNLPLSSIVVW